MFWQQHVTIIKYKIIVSEVIERKESVKLNKSKMRWSNIKYAYFLFSCKTNYHLAMHRGEPGAMLVQLFKRQEDT